VRVRDLEEECCGDGIKHHRRGQTFFGVGVGSSVIHHVFGIVLGVGIIGVTWWDAFHGGIAVHIVVCIHGIIHRVVSICCIGVGVGVVGGVVCAVRGALG
jgi:hypothetical protein